jgi:preprotein translocase subunit SecG
MQALNIFYVLIAIAMVALILVQKGAGATAGAAFGSGASGTVFGSRGAGNFLTRTTWVLATLFCTISLLMAVLVSRMSADPEGDLGVLANAPEVSETIVVDDNPVPAIPEDLGVEDLPVANINAEDQVESAASEILESAEDLPSIDETGAASTVNDQDDPASGTESDGS